MKTISNKSKKEVIFLEKVKHFGAFIPLYGRYMVSREVEILGLTWASALEEIHPLVQGFWATKLVDFPGIASEWR